MGRITSFSKQVIVFFLVTALIIRPTFASAVGGWTMGNPVAQGASVVYDGTKKVIIDGKDYIKKGTAVITPTATGVAKVLAKGVAGVALSVAVEQILGSVDWVLDPANNQIRYSSPNSDSSFPTFPYLYVDGTGYSLTQNPENLKCGGSVSLPLSQAIERTKYCLRNLTTFEPAKTGVDYVSETRVNVWRSHINTNFPDAVTTISINRVANPAYDPQATDQPKTIPLEVVAAQVISNAEGNTDKKSGAQAATTAAAADIVAEAEKDNVKARPIAQQLESTAQTKPADEAVADKANEATGTSKPNTSNPEATDLTLEFPAFCGWAPTVCEAAQTVISFPTTLADWWNTGKTKAEEWSTSISEAWTKVKEEYADKPEENTDTELDIPDLSDESIDSDISFGGSCPAPLSSDINFMGLNKTIEFSFDPVCQIAEFIKPVVISISAFSAALIVAGIRTEDD